jgi:hypothetical protein
MSTKPQVFEIMRIVLADVTPPPAFVPAPAPTTHYLPLRVDGGLFARALKLADAATTEPEQRAVADVWEQPRRTKRAAPSAMANAEVLP